MIIAIADRFSNSQQHKIYIPHQPAMVTNPKHGAFKDWLRQQGGYVNPKVDLFHQLPSGDRGVYAAADIAEGEQLLLVPVSSTLHLDVTDARYVT